MKHTHPDLTTPAKTKAIKALERGNVAQAARIVRRDQRRQARRLAARQGSASIPRPQLSRAQALRKYYGALRAPGVGQFTRMRALVFAVRKAIELMRG